jgi:hypothetical protein
MEKQQPRNLISRRVCRLVQYKLHGSGYLRIVHQRILPRVMGQIVQFRVFLVGERHAVVYCVEEMFVFLYQRDAFGQVVVPFHEAQCGVEGGVDDGCVWRGRFGNVV